MTYKKETVPRFAGIGGHHSPRAGTVEWATPPEIIAALGPFDLDPCAPLDYPFPAAPERFTVFDDGLLLPWVTKRNRKPRVWLNPPYEDGVIEQWLAKMALHDRGTALIFARTETEAFWHHVWNGATALLFMRGRINFHVIEPFSVLKTKRTYLAGDRAKGNAGAPTVLCAYGADDADVLATCKIEGRFVPLRIPRSVFVSFFPTANEGEKIDMTWAAALAEFFDGRPPGPVPLDDVYRHFAGHPKAAGRRNFDAKLRQQLQRGPYRRVARGVWEARSNG